VTQKQSTDAAVAASAAAVATMPYAAGAFVYDGKEYFDITFGISPLYWFLCTFSLLYFGAVLKNALIKYNVPNSVGPPPKASGFQGKELENSEAAYRVK